MTKLQFTRAQAQQIMETCNPLGLIDVNNRLRVFTDPVICYETLINMLYAKCPRGWVDIAFMMHKLQGIRVAHALELCKRARYAVITWDCKPCSEEERTVKNRLKSICYCFLRFTGCEFSETAFNAAWFSFNEAIGEHKFYDPSFEVEHINAKITR